MKHLISLFLTILLLLPAIVSCTGTSSPGGEAGSLPEEGSSSYHEDVPATEIPVTEGIRDPFEGADPLPDDFAFPDNLSLEDGTVLGSVVLPAAAEDNSYLSLAAEELRLHIQLVTGADLPVVGRTSEACGSLILATPETLPAIAEWFADDLSWLSDLGSAESGVRFGSDGFAVRRLGKDIYVIGTTDRGVLNGAYDFLEENLGILWGWADPETGTFYEKAEHASVTRFDYREKSPFEYRGWNLCGVYNKTGGEEAFTVCSRNKANTLGVSGTDLHYMPFGHTIKSALRNSPIYDPEETDYWETDEDGNPLGESGSQQVNPWSDKAAEAIAAYVVQTMNDSGTRKVFIGEEDMSKGRCVPYDTQPFEYAPGEFVSPEDENFYSTVFFTMINKIARLVREQIPDGMVGTFAYSLGVVPVACKLEENVYVIFAPICEDLQQPLLDQSIKEKPYEKNILSYCDWIIDWSEMCDNLLVYNYYMCYRSAYYQRPIWDRMQDDMQNYVKLGVIGLVPEGVPDATGTEVWFTELDDQGPHRIWDMNALTFWLYTKLAWNPDEDVNALITDFCDKVYGDASPYMQEYYRLIKQGWDDGVQAGKRLVDHHTETVDYFKRFVRDPGIGHPVLDTLELALEAAKGPVKEKIQWIYDCFWRQLTAFRNF